jgi:hypothetical protein
MTVFSMFYVRRLGLGVYSRVQVLCTNYKSFKEGRS